MKELEQLQNICKTLEDATSKDNKLEEIFDLVADKTKARIKSEKGTSLSEEAYRMIALTQSLYNSVNFVSHIPDLF